MAPLLLCYDGSDDAKLAIERAGELFGGGEAIALHVWEPLGDVASVPAVPGLEGALKVGLEQMDDLGAEISERLASEAGELARAAGFDARSLSVRRSGRAWTAILATAREHDVSAIVVGRRGASAIELKVLGSVANAVVHHADRPVLVVPVAR